MLTMLGDQTFIVVELYPLTTWCCPAALCLQWWFERGSTFHSGRVISNSGNSQSGAYHPAIHGGLDEHD